MMQIDRYMYEHLKNWCDGDRPRYQKVMYVNSRDRALTDMTIRKLMYEMNEEDEHGDEYTALFSAEHFYGHMREYFLYVAKLYRHKPEETDSLEVIITDFPKTCGWLTLIVEDMELLSGETDKLSEIFRAVVTFASMGANIILIGKGDYKKIFAGCDPVLEEMESRLSVKEESGVVGIAAYDQYEMPDREEILYDSIDKRRDELWFYWEEVEEQLDKKYFDYEFYKTLLKESLDYFVTAAAGDRIFRKDIRLLESINAMKQTAYDGIEGCKPWEFEAARLFADGLHWAVINYYDEEENTDLSKGELFFYADVKEPDEDHGSLYVQSSIGFPITMTVENVDAEMEKLADEVRHWTFQLEKKYGH